MPESTNARQLLEKEAALLTCKTWYRRPVVQIIIFMSIAVLLSVIYINAVGIKRADFAIKENEATAINHTFSKDLNLSDINEVYENHRPEVFMVLPAKINDESALERLGKVWKTQIQLWDATRDAKIFNLEGYVSSTRLESDLADMEKGYYPPGEKGPILKSHSNHVEANTGNWLGKYSEHRISSIEEFKSTELMLQGFARSIEIAKKEDQASPAELEIAKGILMTMIDDAKAILDEDNNELWKQAETAIKVSTNVEMKTTPLDQPTSIREYQALEAELGKFTTTGAQLAIIVLRDLEFNLKHAELGQVKEDESR